MPRRKSQDMWMQECERLKLELRKMNVAIDCLTHQNINMFVFSTRSSPRGGNVVPYGSKQLLERRYSKRRQNLYEHMNQRELKVETARCVSAFYNIVDPSEHLFRSEFVCSFGVFLPNMGIRDPNKVLCNDKKPIVDWRGRAGPYLLNKAEKKELTANNAIFIFPSISFSEKTNDGEYNDTECILCLYCLVCPHEEATRGTLSVSYQLSMKNFIAQSICSIRGSHSLE